MKRALSPTPVASRGPIRVAIAGQGRSGYKLHANWLQRAPDQFEVVAVADQLPERRADAKRDFGARTYADYSLLLRDGGFDLLVNALPSLLHTPVTIEALRAGFHVVCEKPFATKVRDVDRMARTATKANRLLAPFQNNRLQPFVIKMMEVVNSGVLGEILHVRSTWGAFSRRWDWQTLQKNGGGVLHNTGPHAVDIALLFFEESVKPQVFCRMRFKNTLGGDAEDLCALTLSAAGGPIVEIHLTSYLAYPPADMFTVSGTLGSLAGGSHGLRWKFYDPTHAPQQLMWTNWSENREYPRESLPWKQQEWTLDEMVATGPKSGYTLESFQSGVQAFYDNVFGVLRRGESLLITVPQVRRQIEVLVESHRQNAELARQARKQHEP